MFDGRAELSHLRRFQAGRRRGEITRHLRYRYSRAMFEAALPMKFNFDVVFISTVDAAGDRHQPITSSSMAQMPPAPIENKIFLLWHKWPSDANAYIIQGCVGLFMSMYDVFVAAMFLRLL